MKMKLTVLVTMLALAAGAFFFAAPAYAGLSSMPTTVSHSQRSCGSHHQHRGHYWSCGDRNFWCPGHCD